MMRSLLLGLLAFASTPWLAAQELRRTQVSVQLSATDHYPFDVCLVTNRALTKDSVTFEAGGRKFKVADAISRELIEKAPKSWVAKLDAAAVANQSQDCVMDRCPGCRNVFPPDVDPLYAIPEGVVLRVCSEACQSLSVPRVGRAMTSVRGTLAQRTAKPYAGKACPVCDTDLDDKAIWVQHGWALIKTHAGDCLTTLRVTPNKYVNKALGRTGAAAAVDTPKPEVEGDKKPTDKKPPVDKPPVEKGQGADAPKRDGAAR